MIKHIDLQEEEIDAIGEISNILAGAAACCIGDKVDLEVDITVPEIVKDISRNLFYHDGDMKGLHGYRLLSLNEVNHDSHEFSGYCMIVAGDAFENFDKKIELEGQRFYNMLNDAINSVSYQLKLLLNKEIVVEKIVDDTAKEKHHPEEIDRTGKYVAIKFGMTIDSDVRIEFVFMFEDFIAKDIADRFIKQGVAINV